MIDYLEQQRESKHPVKEEKKPPVERLKPLFKNNSVEMQKLIVFLRYGSTTEVRPKQRTWREIQEITGVRKVASCLICKRWRLNGCQVINKKKGYRNRSKWQTPEVVNYLTK